MVILSHHFKLQKVIHWTVKHMCIPHLSPSIRFMSAAICSTVSNKSWKWEWPGIRACDNSWTMDNFPSIVLCVHFSQIGLEIQY